MNTLPTVAPTESQKVSHTRLVSFENSNSWIKRHDSEGTLLIQAGYRENPTAVAKGDDLNPIVITSNYRRWYGAKACQGEHFSSHERDKLSTQREHFAACLRPSDHGRDLIVVAAHWDPHQLDALTSALRGQYRVTRNGQEIHCTVTQVLPILEGQGSYWMVKNQLEPGNTLLIELGYGTAEEWVFDHNGDIQDGQPISKLSVLSMVKAIAQDPSVRAGLGITNQSQTVNLSLISAGLKQDSIGRISEANWLAIKQKYARQFLETLRGYLVAQHGSQMQSLSNITLTGGGAALLAGLAPEVVEYFALPPHPQTASVIGAYQAQMARI